MFERNKGRGLNIPIETCISQYSPRVSGCSQNDYSCLCVEYTNLLTCYNNCPKDTNSSGIKSSVTSFCNAAAAASSASALTNTAKSTSGTGSSTAASSAPTGSGSPTTTKAPSSSSSSSSGSGSSNAALALTPVGTYGALAGVMAIAGIFL
ncbi:unnamed protein product [Tuber melanosporum]|uniref:(Perigord truffle) hypothetical protein n=1 Tax=Tuber melanosporum (strain Mel28) TaxID=656061 RepID=D5GP80_TUBMM|nr:uncharacterized protein GSTUM_00011745001 [Tuber melanosporum]CAZ86345.1 unnamed protein product [Tuber melanosporum]